MGGSSVHRSIVKLYPCIKFAHRTAIAKAIEELLKESIRHSIECTKVLAAHTPKQKRKNAVFGLLGSHK